ncbi:MAG: hypothetical protein GYB64_14300 [Chloroflexi bacterium]|nr:hypothetical protein [Chloroflexota bacterium]
MRVLNEMMPDETLVAKGRYHYLVDGEPSGQVETWQITRLPDGSEVVRADLDGRTAEPRANLVSHLKRTPEGRPQWLRIRFGHKGITAAAHYTFEPAEVRVFRQVEGHPRRQDVLDVPSAYEVDYHAVIAHDYVWRGYPDHARGRRWAVPVFSPELWPQAADDALMGRSLRFMIEPTGAQVCETPVRLFEGAQGYGITLSDGTKAQAWYDTHGIPLRWTYPDKAYEFIIVGYKRYDGIKEEKR